MKRMRNGLLMILMVALVVPAPAVGASAPSPDASAAHAASAAPDAAPAGSAAAMPFTPVSSPASSGDVSSMGAVSAPIAPQANPAPASPPPVSPAMPAPSTLPPTVPPVNNPAAPQPPLAAAPPANNPAAPPSVSHAPLTPPAPTTPPAARLIITKVHLDDPEVIELFNPDDQPVSLAGVRIEFLAKGKLPVLLKRFHEGSVSARGFVVIGSGDGVDVPFDKKTKNLINLSGALRVTVNDDSEDELLFGDGASLKTLPGKRFLQRCRAAAEEFIGTPYDTERFGSWPDCQPPAPSANTCSGVRLSEIGAHSVEQFIELENTTGQPVELAGCRIAAKKGRRSSEFVLPSQTLAPSALLRIAVRDAKLQLGKTGGEVYLLTSTGDEIDETAYHDLARGTSWALIDDEWHQTHAPTPGATNHFQRWQACEAGKQINEATGKCVKIPPSPVVYGPAECPAGYYRHPETKRCRKLAAPAAGKTKQRAPCKEGQYRSEATGRCRSIASAAAKTLKPCKDGYFRSPDTGRCRKIAAASDVVKQCPEGYERNPSTKRCRKIRSATAPVVGFAPQQVQQVAGATWGWWVFGGASLLAVSYGAWQWRWEISRLARRIGAVFTSGKK